MTKENKKSKFWNKQDSLSDKISKLINYILFIVLIGLVIFISFNYVSANTSWFRFSQDGAEIIKDDTKSFVSERYEVSAINGTEAKIKLKIKLDYRGENKSIDIGEFKFDYMKSTIYFHGEEITATILYTLPDNWMLNSTSAEAKYVVVDKRKQKVRGDPIFLRGKDFPNTLLIDSIEIHVDAVKIYQYEEYNETAYNFIFSASENQTDMDIIDFEISGNNLIKGVPPGT